MASPGRCHVYFSIFYFFYIDIIISSKTIVHKNMLHQCIESEGFYAVIPCSHCVHLYKVCFKSKNSDYCSKCVCSSGMKCKILRSTYSDTKWHYLIKLQQQITKEYWNALAKMMWLEHQELLLQSYASDFIACDYKEIAELEDLKC